MPKTVITLGDPGGIGYEIFLKSYKYLIGKDVIVIGNISTLEYYSKTLNIEYKKKGLEFINIGETDFKPDLGVDSKKNGMIAIESINEAIKIIKKDNKTRLLTGPVSKKAIVMAGYNDFRGHTDYLAESFGIKKYTMLLANPDFCVALVTIHEPITRVPSLINKEIVETTILHLNEFKKKTSNEKIYVCGLNPHAGEGGSLGKEEIDIIIPVLESLKKRNVNVDGPFPADSIFKKAYSKEAKYFVAMYHDQGLIPLKMVSNRVVNITLGLPFFRISVGHGTGFDIVGKGIADNISFVECLRFLELIS